MRNLVWIVLLVGLVAAIVGIAWWNRVPPPPPAPSAAELMKRGQAQAADLHVLDAEKSYQAALQADPKNADGWLALATLYTASRRHADALAAMEQWQKIAPPVSSWTYTMLHCFGPNDPEGYQRARAAVTESLRREPRSAVLHTDMAGLVLLGMHRVTPAEQTARLAEVDDWLKKAAALGAHDANYYVVLGEARLLENRPAEAQQALTEAIRIGLFRETREEIVARMDLGLLDLHQGKLAEGRKMLDGADAAYSDRHEFTLLTSRPVHEAAIMTRHVYFGGAVPLDELKAYRARYDTLTANEVGGQVAMLTFRTRLNDFYVAIAENDAARAMDLGTQLVQTIDELTGCAFITAMRDHFRAMVWVEIGDMLHARHDDTQAVRFYLEAAAIYPADRVIAARLAAARGKQHIELSPPATEH